MNKSVAIVLSTLLAAVAVSSYAQTAAPAAAPMAAATPGANWKANHPRRVEVNQRLKKQNARIEAKEATGGMSHAKAARLHKEDAHIRHEERVDAAKNGGHITKAEQAGLNQQENRVSNQINK